MISYFGTSPVHEPPLLKMQRSGLMRALTISKANSKLFPHLPHDLLPATMEVKEDFYMYRGGVYRYTMPESSTNPNLEDQKSGYHSVKIVGYECFFLNILYDCSHDQK